MKNALNQMNQFAHGTHTNPYHTQQKETLVESIQEFNDTRNRHKYLWLLLYRAHRVEVKQISHDKHDPSVKQCIKTFYSVAKDTFIGVARDLLAEDLSNFDTDMYQDQNILQECIKFCYLFF